MYCSVFINIVLRNKINHEQNVLFDCICILIVPSSSQTVKSGNLRALYGLLVTCRALNNCRDDLSVQLSASSNSALEENQAVTNELYQWGLEQLEATASSSSGNSILNIALAAFRT